MNVTVVTPPPFEPVSWTEVFLHLRLGDADDAADAEDFVDYPLLVTQIEAARKYAEQATHRSFIQQTLRLSRGERSGRWGGWYGWYSWCSGYAPAFELPQPPLISVSSVSYYDQGNVLQIVAPGDYYVSDDVVPRLYMNDGFGFPLTGRREDAVRVEYVVGYPPGGNSPPTTQEDYAANVPGGIKQAILLGVQLQYDDLTSDQAAKIERARDSLLSGFTLPVLA